MNEKERSEELFREYLARRDSGETVSSDEYLRQYPKLENRLKKLFKNIEEGSSGEADRFGETGSIEGIDEKTQILGDFQIIRRIGSGGMATVYEARQISLKRNVALKILPAHLSLSDRAVQKFYREAEAGGRQHHHGIVEVYAVGHHEDIYYIAQELVEGSHTLADRMEEIRSGEALPIGYFRDTAELIAKVANALQYAHASGVIHRDMKPSNILLTKAGDPKVMDFGLAKVQDALALSRTGDFAGTPYYMSPEQAMSRRIEIDHRTDIYSLGVTLYEALTLKRPFEGKTSHEILRQIILNEPPNPRKVNPRVPRDLEVICLKALEKDPNRRYQSMSDFEEDLRAFLYGEVIRAKPAGLGNRLWKRVKRNPVVSAATGVTLAAVVVLVLVVPWLIAQKESDNAKALEIERNKALVAQNIAVKQARIAEDRYQQIIRLADVKRLSDLKKELDSLWPAYPETIPDLEHWIIEAEKILDRLDEHRRTLSALREGALSSEGEAEGPDHTWKFKTIETEWQHEVLQGLVSDLEGLLDDERGGLRDVKDRLSFASTIEARSIEDQREAWDRAIASIADRDTCPKYDGLVIKHQIGMVPIGPDTASGLWEFAHLQTGVITERGPDGQLALGEETGLVFVLIPGGSFNMGSAQPSGKNPAGSPNVDPYSESDEKPVHQVTIKPFFLSKYEVTQGQWLRFTGENPSLYGSGKKSGVNDITLLHPVEQISWDDCVRILFRLKLRLPSESEWEYAARAGTTTAWHTGNDEHTLEGYVNLCDQYLKKNGGHPSWNYIEWLNDGHAVHAPVGSYLPNAFGLHDVSGNVWEWCQDSHGEYDVTPTDGSAYELEGTPYRVYRGSSYHNYTRHCRSAARSRVDQGHRLAHIGVRPACSLLE